MGGLLRAGQNSCSPGPPCPLGSRGPSCSRDQKARSQPCPGSAVRAQGRWERRGGSLASSHGGSGEVGGGGRITEQCPPAPSGLLHFHLLPIPRGQRAATSHVVPRVTGPHSGRGPDSTSASVPRDTVRPCPHLGTAAAAVEYPAAALSS